MTNQRERGEPLFLPNPEPNGLVVLVGAVCGFLVGLGAAGLVYLGLRGLGPISTLLLFTVVPVAFAYAAARWGRVFWEFLRDAIW